MTQKPMQLCVTIPLSQYNVLVFITILKTTCAPCETGMCKCDTLLCVSVSVCDDLTSHWMCALVCVGPSHCARMCELTWSLLSPGTWHMPLVAS